MTTATAVRQFLHAQVLRMRRTVAVASGLGGYLLFVYVAHRYGMLRLPDVAFVVATAMAAIGVVLLAYAVGIDRELTTNRKSALMPFAVWGAVALMSMAVISDSPLRLLLLAASLLGLTFSALHLDRSQLTLLAATVWGTYLVGVVAGFNAGVMGDAQTVALNMLGYSLALIGGVLVAGEVGRLKSELEGRTRDLERALVKVHELAMRDDLTGLYNRRQLMEYLQRQKALADRNTLSFALCYVDLDHFKRVNDRFGHSQGDDVLKAFAEIARRVVREEDFVARMGGEEFVLVLTNATLTDAVRVAERLRRQTQLMVIHPNAPDFAVTASVGIAAYRLKEPVEQLLSRADAAMYAAKTQGRNRVVVAPETETDAARAGSSR